MAARKRAGTDDRQGGFFAPPADPAPMVATMDAALESTRREVTFAPPQTPFTARKATGFAHACVGCGKHYFPYPDVVCYWCQQRLLDAAPSAQ